MKRARGRPPKINTRNISGLRNQVKEVSKEAEHAAIPVTATEYADGDPDEILDHCWLGDEAAALAWRFGYEEADSDNESQLGEEDDEMLEEIEWDATDDELVKEELTERLCRYAAAMGGNTDDAEWLPAETDRLRKRQKKKTKKRGSYHTGPDLEAKAERTKQRYRKSINAQSKLSAFGFGAPLSLPTRSLGSNTEPAAPPLAHSCSNQQVLSPIAIDNTSGSNEHPFNAREPVFVDSDTEQDIPMEAPPVEAAGEDSLEDDPEVLWEEEADVHIGGSEEGILTDWKEVYRDITAKLDKGKRNGMGVSETNQLLIIRNFAILQLKGFGRMRASREIALQWKCGDGVHFARRVRAMVRHYQVFQELPKENRGGFRTSRSLLSNANVKARCLLWLKAQKAGEVTPHRFIDALTTEILPSCDIILDKPLSERTARRWLNKLGWRLTMLKKGVYMDGHDRPDVIEYRQNVFLPAMEAYQHRMATYNKKLERSAPVLAPGETEVIALFHDESSFHANEYKASAWSANFLPLYSSSLTRFPSRLEVGQTILQKKSRGRLIHISDFITQEGGRLVTRDSGGKIVRDARKVIFPGAQGDPWWDTAQLLVQMLAAISIFEEAHPGCVALFIFDQSSAHAALPADALKAFEMNKSNGGKQRKQQDTVIPLDNPSEVHRGKIQKMTLEDGTAKGLQLVLEERGFNVRGLRAKCAPVCPFENQGCCMARLLSQQADFQNQPSMLETMLRKAGHACLFLPKFHCELNPIEMVRDSPILSSFDWILSFYYHSIGDGVSTVTGKFKRLISRLRRRLPCATWMHAQ